MDSHLEIVAIIIDDLSHPRTSVKHDLTVRYPFDQDRMLDALQSGDILRFKLDDWRAIVVDDMVAFYHVSDRNRCLACESSATVANKDEWRSSFEKQTVKRVRLA